MARNTLNFIAMCKGVHVKKINLACGEITWKESKTNGNQYGGKEAFLQKSHPYITVGMDKTVSLEWNKNNVRVAAICCMHNVLEAEEDGTSDAIEKEIEVIKAEEAKKAKETPVKVEGSAKLTAAVDKYTSELSDWPAQTLKAVAKELEVDPEASKEDMIAAIKSAIDSSK